MLLRSLEALEGQDAMRSLRGVKRADKGSGFKPHELCNGPSKLTQAFGITKANSNQIDLSTSQQLWLEEEIEMQESNIVTTRRVGIDNYDKEWVMKPLRFYVKGNRSVSLRDKQAESALVPDRRKTFNVFDVIKLQR